MSPHVILPIRTAEALAVLRAALKRKIHYRKKRLKRLAKKVAKP